MLRTFSWYVWLEVLSRASRRHMMHLSTSLCKPKMRHFGAFPQKCSLRRDAKNQERGFSESLMPQKRCQYQPHITQDEYIRKNRVAFCVERGLCLAGISTQKSKDYRFHHAICWLQEPQERHSTIEQREKPFDKKRKGRRKMIGCKELQVIEKIWFLMGQFWMKSKFF